MVSKNSVKKLGAASSGKAKSPTPELIKATPYAAVPVITGSMVQKVPPVLCLQMAPDQIYLFTTFHSPSLFLLTAINFPFSCKSTVS